MGGKGASRCLVPGLTSPKAPLPTVRMTSYRFALSNAYGSENRSMGKGDTFTSLYCSKPISPSWAEEMASEAARTRSE